MTYELGERVGGWLVNIISVIVIVAGLYFFMTGIAWVINHASLPGNLADIEQLRTDASDVDPAQAEDVIGQVVEKNRWLAETQALNQTWWFGWTIPDDYDQVPFIEVPQ